LTCIVVWGKIVVENFLAKCFVEVIDKFYPRLIVNLALKHFTNEEITTYINACQLLVIHITEGMGKILLKIPAFNVSMSQFYK